MSGVPRKAPRGHRVTQQFCSQMSVHPREMKMCVQTTCTQMFVAA